jgi:hypothetical protein
MFLAPSRANAARDHHTPFRCEPNSRTVLADSRAQVYSTPEDIDGTTSLRACAYGQRRSFLIALCTEGYTKYSPIECIRDVHVTLTGTLIAYELSRTSEWYVVVLDLRTGRVLRKVPTGAPLQPEPGYVGVGSLEALVLASDGSVAWIARDSERSAIGPPTTPEGTRPTYLDVYASDRSGTRLLAAGTNIDPSSLALSTGTGPDHYPNLPGKTVYWTQGGQTASAALN